MDLKNLFNLLATATVLSSTTAFAAGDTVVLGRMQVASQSIRQSTGDVYQFQLGTCVRDRRTLAPIRGGATVLVGGPGIGPVGWQKVAVDSLGCILWEESYKLGTGNDPQKFDRVVYFGSTGEALVIPLMAKVSVRSGGGLNVEIVDTRSKISDEVFDHAASSDGNAKKIELPMAGGSLF